MYGSENMYKQNIACQCFQFHLCEWISSYSTLVKVNLKKMYSCSFKCLIDCAVSWNHSLSKTNFIFNAVCADDAMMQWVVLFISLVIKECGIHAVIYNINNEYHLILPIYRSGKAYGIGPTHAVLWCNPYNNNWSSVKSQILDYKIMITVGKRNEQIYLTHSMCQKSYTMHSDER